MMRVLEVEYRGAARSQGWIVSADKLAQSRRNPVENAMKINRDGYEWGVETARGEAQAGRDARCLRETSLRGEGRHLRVRFTGKRWPMRRAAR